MGEKVGIVGIGPSNLSKLTLNYLCKYGGMISNIYLGKIVLRSGLVEIKFENVEETWAVVNDRKLEVVLL